MHCVRAHVGVSCFGTCIRSVHDRRQSTLTRRRQSAKGKTAATLTVEKLQQDLQKAGFTDVKVLEDAFLIQAKTKDGNSILLTIGPNGMNALEVLNVSGTS